MERVYVWSYWCLIPIVYNGDVTLQSTCLYERMFVNFKLVSIVDDLYLKNLFI